MWQKGFTETTNLLFLILNLDPLNAALVSTSDDPLFASSKTTPNSKTSQSSRTNSPILASSDPLSRNASPLDASSSTPISPRRSTATKSNGTSSSIFGDIDVSKLGGSNGLYNGSNNGSKRVSATSLRSTSTLRSSRQFDEDEEDLFGGGRVSRTRVLSKATSPTPSVTSSSASSIKKTSPIVINNTLPPQQPQEQATIPAPRKAATASPPPPPPPVQPPIQVTPETPSAKVTTPKLNSSSSSINETDKPATTEERPTSSSSFFASASRFFKSSSSNTNSKTSSSASSIASVGNATSAKIEKQEEEEEEKKRAAAATPPLPPPRQQQQAQPQVKQQQQQQRQIPSLKSQLPPTIDTRQVQVEEEEEEEEEEVVNHPPVIEDEATRAFADDVISFQPTRRPDYAAISPDLSLLTPMDSLHLDTTTPLNKRLLPSASTPTAASVADVDDPWFDGAVAVAAAATANTHRIIVPPPPHMLLVEPSMSSPPIQQQHHKISEKDIEPQKRSAFADLISSWNTGQSLDKVLPKTEQEDSQEQFFSHVAEEQRDIGFAGISATVDNEEDTSNRRVVVADVWDSNEENPWN